MEGREIHYFDDTADTALVAPAVKAIILNGDYLVVGIDVSCPRQEILHCFSTVIENYVEH
ncbi:MAG: hypothetical protein JXR85_01565 [Deltaproteobacteria bacterium]|nr:hypothetical protein [Deltaproteobacteria bacterium]